MTMNHSTCVSVEEQLQREMDHLRELESGDPRLKRRSAEFASQTACPDLGSLAIQTESQLSHVLGRESHFANVGPDISSHRHSIDGQRKSLAHTELLLQVTEKEKESELSKKMQDIEEMFLADSEKLALQKRRIEEKEKEYKTKTAAELDAIQNQTDIIDKLDHKQQQLIMYIEEQQHEMSSPDYERAAPIGASCSDDSIQIGARGYTRPTRSSSLRHKRTSSEPAAELSTPVIGGKTGKSHPRGSMTPPPRASTPGSRGTTPPPGRDVRPKSLPLNPHSKPKGKEKTTVLGKLGQKLGQVTDRLHPSSKKGTNGSKKINPEKGGEKTSERRSRSNAEPLHTRSQSAPILASSHGKGNAHLVSNTIRAMSPRLRLSSSSLASVPESLDEDIGGGNEDINQRLREVSMSPDVFHNPSPSRGASPLSTSLPDSRSPLHDWSNMEQVMQPDGDGSIHMRANTRSPMDTAQNIARTLGRQNVQSPITSDSDGLEVAKLMNVDSRTDTEPVSTSKRSSPDGHDAPDTHSGHLLSPSNIPGSAAAKQDLLQSQGHMAGQQQSDIFQVSPEREKGSTTSKQSKSKERPKSGTKSGSRPSSVSSESGKTKKKSTSDDSPSHPSTSKSRAKTWSGSVGSVGSGKSASAESLSSVGSKSSISSTVKKGPKAKTSPETKGKRRQSGTSDKESKTSPSNKDGRKTSSSEGSKTSPKPTPGLKRTHSKTEKDLKGTPVRLNVEATITKPKKIKKKEGDVSVEIYVPSPATSETSLNIGMEEDTTMSPQLSPTMARRHSASSVHSQDEVLYDENGTKIIQRARKSTQGSESDDTTGKKKMLEQNFVVWKTKDGRTHSAGELEPQATSVHSDEDQEMAEGSKDDVFDEPMEESSGAYSDDSLNGREKGRINVTGSRPLASNDSDEVMSADPLDTGPEDKDSEEHIFSDDSLNNDKKGPSPAETESQSGVVGPCQAGLDTLPSHHSQVHQTGDDPEYSDPVTTGQEMEEMMEDDITAPPSVPPVDSHPSGVVGVDVTAETVVLDNRPRGCPYEYAATYR